MEFAKVGDKPGELSLTAARDQAREYRLALKKDGVDPRHKKQIEAKGGTDVQGLCGEEISGLVHGQAQRRTQVVGTVDPRRAEPARPQAT
jgi:hypothetical protein